MYRSCVIPRWERTEKRKLRAAARVRGSSISLSPRLGIRDHTHRSVLEDLSDSDLSLINSQTQILLS